MTLYRLTLPVLRCEERRVATETRTIDGKPTVTKEETLGWFLTLTTNGAPVSFNLGPEPVNLRPGDLVRLTIEKAAP